MLRWSNDVTIQFIELYESQTCLWNVYHKHYRNVIKRRESFNYIRNKMPLILTVDDIRNKIKVLRDTYKLEVKKIYKMSNEGVLYVPRLIWFKKFKTILDKTHMEKTKDIDGDKEKEELPQIKIENGDQLNDNVLADTEVTIESAEELNAIELTYSDETFLCQEEGEREDDVEMNVSVSHQQTNGFDTGKELLNDEFQMFANNIAEQLRHLPLDKALRLQLSIQKLLAKERIALFKRSSQKQGSIVKMNF